ncbi:MAG: RidA family protein [Cytophagaceae bacterium]
MDLKANLKKLGLELPVATNPGGNYVSVNRRGKLAFIAIQFPFYNGKALYMGKLGHDLSSEDGYRAMQLCALNVLAQVNEKMVLKTC